MTITVTAAAAAASVNLNIIMIESQVSKYTWFMPCPVIPRIYHAYTFLILCLRSPLQADLNFQVLKG